MVKFGKNFTAALVELTELRPEVAQWPRIDYKYHKNVLYGSVLRAARTPQPVLMRTEITGGEPMIDASADDDA